MGPTNHAQKRRDVAGAQRELGRADAGVVGDEGDVTDSRQLRAAGQAEAVDLHDDGKAEIPDLQPAADDPLELGPVGGHALRGHTARRHVVAGTERPARAPHDGDVHGAVVGRPFERLQQLLLELGVMAFSFSGRLA